MAATRVYSTAAYYVAAIVAILFGLSPKFGALVSATPGGVLGGITVVLYGMIGLLGAKIWKENGVDFGNPVNLVPLAAGIVIAIGGSRWQFTDDFTLSGIAFGTIVAVGGYHLAGCWPRRRCATPWTPSAGSAAPRSSSTPRRLRGARPVRHGPPLTRPSLSTSTRRVPCVTAASPRPRGAA